MSRWRKGKIAEADRPGDFLTVAALGWRQWQLSPSGYLLSGNLGDVWIGEEVKEAICARSADDHPAPDPECHCGLYAWHTRAEAIGGGYGDVYGAVAGWGRMEIHPDGFRAQFATILALVPGPSTAARRLKALKANALYAAIPIYWTADEIEMEMAARDDVASIPESMRPERPEAPEVQVRPFHGGASALGASGYANSGPVGGGSMMAVATRMPGPPGNSNHYHHGIP